jgi:hypothetical protein
MRCFWKCSGSFMVMFYIAMFLFCSGFVLVLFCWSVLVLFCACYVLVLFCYLVLLWFYSGPVLSGSVLVLFLFCSCSVLVLFLFCSGSVLVLFWFCSGSVLVLFWFCSGSVLVLFWFCSGSVLVLFWFFSDSLMALFWFLKLQQHQFEWCPQDSAHNLSGKRPVPEFIDIVFDWVNKFGHCTLDTWMMVVPWTTGTTVAK